MCWADSYVYERECCMFSKHTQTRGLSLNEVWVVLCCAGHKSQLRSNLMQFQDIAREGILIMDLLRKQNAPCSCLAFVPRNSTAHLAIK